MNYKRKFTYSRKDVNCKFCTEYRGKNKCPHSVCPYIAERIEAGDVTYASAVMAMFPHYCNMLERLPKLLLEYPDNFFLDDRHKARMEFFNTRLGYVPSRNTPAYYAALYLLTANDTIHWRTANCFCHDGVDFEYAILQGICIHNYALYRAALGLCLNQWGVTLSELADKELVDDTAFRLIINAMLIARFGVAAFKLKKEVPRDE